MNENELLFSVFVTGFLIGSLVSASITLHFVRRAVRKCRLPTAEDVKFPK
jgi:hypothetical protein